MLIGASLSIGAILVDTTWLSICFATIILRIVLLIFVPEILLAPFSIGLATSLAFIASCDE